VRRVALLLLLLGTACRSSTTATPQQSLEPGRVAQGSVSFLKSTLRDMRGKPVVVNYWATWCVPCRAEMPRIAAAASQYASSVRFLGVDVEDDTKSAEDYARQRGVHYPMLSDAHGAIRRDQRIVGLPVTQFYSADGALAFVNNGEIQTADLTKRIGDLLAVGKPVRDGAKPFPPST
jgi:cytochrome c biogenesis protein CcmG/thiol:disulfide interchange protein DsbE